MIVNRHPKLELFTREDVEKIHQASLGVLEETGFAVLCEEALDIYEATPGTKVDRDRQRVWIDRSAVERALALCPASYTVYARNPKYNRTHGGDNIYLTPSVGRVIINDLERGRRLNKLADAIELVKIVHQLPIVDPAGGLTGTIEDVPVPLRPYVRPLVDATYTDRVNGLPRLAPQAGELDRDPVAEFKEAVAVIFGSDWDYVARPVSRGGAQPVSPLMLDQRMAMSFINTAKAGQPCGIGSAILGGMTAPMTFAGMMVVTNAEFLGPLVLVQSIRPGLPVSYTTWAVQCDMKVGLPPYGSPDMALATNMVCMLARRYGVPSAGCGGASESKIPDVQAGFEHALTALVAVLSGSNTLPSATGVLESLLTSSYEQLVLDQDLMGMIQRLMQPPPITDEELAVDVIHEVGPQGMFLTTDHTYKHFKTAYFQPKLMDRQIYAEWVKRGSKSAAERATEEWKRLLASYQEPEMPIKPEVVQLYHEWIRQAEAEMEEREDWPRHLVGLGHSTRTAERPVTV
ncbi:MAG: trimethylamine methyltransferase family protein [Chloroflexi bacterium]|nr:trimethylamine methyltransferase family protein [Chloroflexota bacterium]